MFRHAIDWQLFDCRGGSYNQVELEELIGGISCLLFENRHCPDNDILCNPP
jgi:hypothetical protein